MLVKTCVSSKIETSEGSMMRIRWNFIEKEFI